MHRRRLLAAMLGAFMLSGACASQRLVTDIASSGDRVSFAWAQRGKGQGIIECTVKPDGSVADCRTIELRFQGER